MLSPFDVLRYSTPLGMAALGETVSQKAGNITIGLEGVMLFGAFTGMSVTSSTGNPWLGILAAIAAGTIANLFASLFTILLAADQVVVGTSINLLALGVTSSLFRARYGQSGQLLSVPRLPSVGPIDVVMVLMVLLVPAIWFILNRTGLGLAIRATGEYPKAVEAAGYSAIFLRYLSAGFCGALGGLAGGYLALGIAGSFSENIVAGRGFVAIAMVTFGRWKPGWVLVATLLIGVAESLQFAFQARGLAVPYQLMIAMPYLIALAVLVLVGRGTEAPAALGEPYRRNT